MSATLRPLRWWDIEDVVAIEREVFDHDPWTPEQFWGELARSPQTRWYVVHEDDRGIDGYAGLYAVPPEADVQTIAVAPQSRGRGVGRELLDAIVAEATRRGCTQLFLEVRVDNARARDLYDRNGFELQARRPDYYGVGQDALVLRRRLDPRGDE